MFKNGDRVMLVDKTSEIPTEGPATIDDVDENGWITATIDRSARESGDVDGLRDMDADQVVLLADYIDPCPGGVHAPITQAVDRKGFGLCCARCNRVIL